jgi:hypothetical protein
MSVEFYVTPLSSLTDDHSQVINGELRRYRNLECVDTVGYSRSIYVAGVDPVDVDRWRRAAILLHERIRALNEKERAVSLHLHQPFDYLLLWKIRYAWRNRVLRKNYLTAVAELRAAVHAAMSVYQEDAGDLPAYLAEYRRRRMESLAAMKAEPVWAYEIDARGKTGRRFVIYRPDRFRRQPPEAARARLTAQQVQDALATERATHPYTTVEWADSADRLLATMYGTATLGWQALTGQLIDPHPRKQRTRRTEWPSSFDPSPSGATDGNDIMKLIDLSSHHLSGYSDSGGSGGSSDSGGSSSDGY